MQELRVFYFKNTQLLRITFRNDTQFLRFFYCILYFFMV